MNLVHIYLHVKFRALGIDWGTVGKEVTVAYDGKAEFSVHELGVVPGDAHKLVSKRGVDLYVKVSP